MRKALIAAGCAAAALVFQATSAFACGGLVAPDGDVHLDKATTFVAWHGGVEHYVTSFSYSGSSAAHVGYIVPLPAVPDKIEAAGRWTLQRLERELNPPRKELFAGAAAPLAADSAQVIQQVQVEALDVTVLKGSGKAVITWCTQNGFVLNEETRDHLLHYAEGTPIFMAARYDTAVAQQRGLLEGDGVPLQITMHTPRLWVPLEVLADDDTDVNADLFLLTDAQLNTTDNPFASLFLQSFDSRSAGAPGFTVAAQEPMNDSLHRDLSSDRNMSWVPSSGWLTYLTLHAPSETVTYDLSVASDNVIRLPAFGVSSVLHEQAPATEQPLWPLAAAAAALLTLGIGVVLLTTRYRTSRHRI
ncbi:MAG TPA: DUF2330 domain-containing protein [Candidatus Dormibacteraeota bacterium]|nr:DUF2330 domain-containing protein [Candidatus Dormibacteraeota bacterium]